MRMLNLLVKIKQIGRSIFAIKPKFSANKMLVIANWNWNSPPFIETFSYLLLYSVPNQNNTCTMGHNRALVTAKIRTKFAGEESLGTRE